MKATEIKSCYVGPAVSPEEFIPEHFFLFLVKGAITGYDGYQKYGLQPGECCLVRRHHLAKYSKRLENGRFEKVVIVFDQAFLGRFQQRHQVPTAGPESQNAFVQLQPDPLIDHFINSLEPYYSGNGKIDSAFADLKREELLLILLRTQPEQARLLFDARAPEKADLESFMCRNYKFNVSLERFAYLTGRSLSTFKRDFVSVFGQTPSKWLVNKRLEEAHFLISEKGEKPSEIYLDLGFEDLSHFSTAYKKRFGHAPTKATTKSKQADAQPSTATGGPAQREGSSSKLSSPSGSARTR